MLGWVKIVQCLKLRLQKLATKRAKEEENQRAHEHEWIQKSFFLKNKTIICMSETLRGSSSGERVGRLVQKATQMH